MIFVDSSFFIAFRNSRDQHRPDALKLLGSMTSEPLLTTNVVKGETFTYLSRKLGHASAVSFLSQLESSEQFSIVRVDEEAEETAWAWLRQHDERAYSFVDATSFAVMKSMRIRDALAFDGDFSAAGFRELRPAS